MKKIKKFFSDNERSEILKFINSLDKESDLTNKHIIEVSSKLKGQSWMFDISKTKLSTELSKFQSSNNLMDIELPEIFQILLNRISEKLKINKDNVFLQILNQKPGGLIYPHYDSALDGYITYKCNVSIESEDFQLFVGDDILNISSGDLYCFEASLYKHWTNPLKKRRIILSYGIILPYKDMGRNDECHRVRLSKRIVKYFQN